MNTLFPLYIGLVSLLLIVQTFLLIYITFLFLRQMKILKQPYGGMEYSESLLAATILGGVLLISSADISGITQATKSYGEDQALFGARLLSFSGRSFLVVLLLAVLFIVSNIISIRILCRGDYQLLTLPVSMLLCAINLGFVLIFWSIGREIIDSITPRIINFQ